MDSYVVRMVDSLHHPLVVLSVSDKINIVGVQNQNAHIVLLLYEIKITLLQMLEIRVVDFLLVISSTLADIMLQMLHIEIKIHHQLRLGDVCKNDVEKP